MKIKIVVIIPARLGSLRLKNKNILPIKNIPMLRVKPKNLNLIQLYLFLRKVRL